MSNDALSVTLGSDRAGSTPTGDKPLFPFRPLLPGESQVPQARPAPHGASHLPIADLARQNGYAPIAIRVAQFQRARRIDDATIVQGVPFPIGVFHNHVTPTDRHFRRCARPTF